MPLVRKIMDVGPSSKAVTIPKSWLEWWERELGEKITQVCIETKGESLILYPYVANRMKEIEKRQKT